MAKLYVQLGLSHEDPQDDFSYREGFRSYVTSHAKPEDYVVLVDASPRAVDELTRLWADQPNAQVVWAQVDNGSTHSRTYFAQPDGSPAPSVFTQDAERALRCCPQGGLVTTEVSCQTLHQLLAEHPETPIALLVWDPEVTPDLDWESLGQLPDAISVRRPVPRDLRTQLKARGYSSAGRAWGEAGANSFYLRASDTAARGRAIAAQARVSAGELIVRVRSLLPTPDERAALTMRTKVALDQRLSVQDVLDPSHGLQLAPLRRDDVLDLANRVTSHPQVRWTLNMDHDDAPADLAQECHARHGLWPISFSFPDAWSDRTLHPERLLSPITPGFPYSFTESDEYLRSYGTAQWGITHRKAGWDCFRHVEILASGAVPLMVDAADIPRFSMVHYPKKALASAAAMAAQHGGAPDIASRAAFQSFFDRHLTCEAMARYLLESCGLYDAERILFVDEQHPHSSDYQSTLTLVGLKRLRGSTVVPLFPAPWLYSDFSDEVGHLYGRGFGYSRSLDPSLKSMRETLDNELPDVDLSTIDTLIVGSISRNETRARELLHRFPAERTIWIHGEDSPPTARQTRDFRSSGTQVFVRSIESRDRHDAPSLRRRARA